MNNRNAVDILLDLEKKVEALLKASQNNDFQLKSLLNIFNLKNAQLPKQEINPNSIKIEAALPEEIIKNQDLAARSHKRVEHVFDQKQLKPKVQEPEFKDVPSVMFNEVDITQKVMLPGKKDAYMCIVTVISLNSKEGHKTKTNAVGKYNLKLKPGKYRITLEKRTVTQELYKVVQEIEIDGTNQKIVLPEVILGAE